MVKFASVLLLAISFHCAAAQDPTAPLDWSATPTPVKKKTVKRHYPPVLQSIVCEKEQQCYAVLSDRVASVGDVVRGYRVQHIDSDNVTLQRSGKLVKLALFSLDIKLN